MTACKARPSRRGGTLGGYLQKSYIVLSTKHVNKRKNIMKLFVGNLSRDVTDAELRAAFEPFGTLSSVEVVKDKFGGGSKGFAFVEMPDKAQAEAAIAGLHRKPLKGQSLDVTEARPREERKSGHGGKRQGGRRSW